MKREPAGIVFTQYPTFGFPPPGRHVARPLLLAKFAAPKPLKILKFTNIIAPRGGSLT